MTNMSDHRIALDGMFLQAADPRRGRGRQWFTDEAHIPSVQKRHTPSVCVDIGFAAMAR
jgi:hypothetical protein